MLLPWKYNGGLPLCLPSNTVSTNSTQHINIRTHFSFHRICNLTFNTTHVAFLYLAFANF